MEVCAVHIVQFCSCVELSHLPDIVHHKRCFTGVTVLLSCSVSALQLLYMVSCVTTIEAAYLLMSSNLSA